MLSVINGFLHFLFLDFHRKSPIVMYSYQIIDFSFQGKSRLFFVYFFFDSTLFEKLPFIETPFDKFGS